MRRGGNPLGFAVAAVILAGCRGSPPPFEPLAPRPVRELRCLEVRAGGERAGWLRFLAVQGPAGGRPFWRVENRFGQWVGWIDRNGRVFRNRPHRERPEQVGSGSLAEGARILLGLEARPDLVGEK